MTNFIWIQNESNNEIEMKVCDIKASSKSKNTIVWLSDAVLCSATQFMSTFSHNRQQIGEAICNSAWLNYWWMKNRWWWKSAKETNHLIILFSNLQVWSLHNISCVEQILNTWIVGDKYSLSRNLIMYFANWACI